MKRILDKLKEEWKEQGTKHKFLAVLGGIGVTFEIFTPIILVALWVSVTGLDNFFSYFLYFIGLLASLFNAIKVGWMK